MMQERIGRHAIAARLSLCAAVVGFATLAGPLGGCDNQSGATATNAANTKVDSPDATSGGAGSAIDPSKLAWEVNEYDGPGVEELKVRVALRSKALVEQDWEALYDMQVQQLREQSTRAEFVEWSQESEPIGYKSHVVHSVEAHRGIGWVQATAEMQQRLFPGNFQSHTLKRWEKWVVDVDGRWQPIPPTTYSQVPEAPSIRDAQQEKRLLARFAESWKLRQQRDWESMYELLSEKTRADRTLEEFAAGQEDLIFVDYFVSWMQVVSGTDAGTVLARASFRYNDPSLQKMEPMVKETRERWVLEDGDWYMHLRPPAKPEDQQQQNPQQGAPSTTGRTN